MEEGVSLLRYYCLVFLAYGYVSGYSQPRLESVFFFAKRSLVLFRNDGGM